MSWRIWRWWLLGACAYLLFILGTLPAAYLVGWLQPRFTGVELEGVTGTLWSGRAERVRIQSVPFGSLDWHFDWRAPFTASLGYSFGLDDGEGRLRGRVDAGVTTLHLRDLQGQLPVAKLDRWLPLPPHSLDGELHIDLPQLGMQHGRLVAAVGSLDMESASLAWPSAYTLGAYRMVLTTSDSGISGHITDMASRLRLRADVTLASDGRYHLVGNLSANDPVDAVTQKLLANLGSPDSTGHYPFSFDGQW